MHRAACMLSAFVLACITASALGSGCSSPKVTVNAFSTVDGTILTQLAHVSELTVKCNNAASPNLFAEFPCGKLVPLARIGDNKYQVSWTEELKKGSSGNIAVRLFDEDGYSKIRKAQRDGDKVSGVKSLVDVNIPTKSAYKGPWVQAELLAALFTASIAYFALTTKSKVQA